MGLIKARPVGYAFVRKPVKLPKKNPNSLQVIFLAIRRRLADGPLGRFIRFAVQRHPYVVGEHGPDCKIHQTANVADAIFNANSGIITVDEYVFFGHGVNLLAGTHDAKKTGLDRQRAVPRDGYDITIERGAWLASNVTIIGPSRIGENSVIAAGAVVIGDVPANAFVGGIPARVLKMLDLPLSSHGENKNSI